MCVVGTAPDRLRWSSTAFAVEVVVDGKEWFTGPATTVVIANGQFLRGLDVVPRGHPGDGKAEVQVYELERRERRSLRARLATGAHLPHPRIRSRTARDVEVRGASPLALEVDGVARTPISGVRVAVVPAAFRLLV
jgi:diacylglycerol kinase family enzyme